METPVVQIPENEVTLADLMEWYRLVELLDKAKKSELLLRLKIFKGKFPNPEEGTNTVELNDGTGAQLKATHVINRSVDKAALATLLPAFRQAQIPEDVVKYTPEVAISVYRKLTDEQRKLFDQALTIKDGMPQLSIVIPKKKAAK